MDTQQLIQDTATKIFSDHCDKALLDRTETGEFASELWQQITANGFHSWVMRPAAQLLPIPMHSSKSAGASRCPCR